MIARRRSRTKCTFVVSTTEKKGGADVKKTKPTVSRLVYGRLFMITI